MQVYSYIYNSTSNNQIIGKYKRSVIVWKGTSWRSCPWKDKSLRLLVSEVVMSWRLLLGNRFMINHNEQQQQQQQQQQPNFKIDKNSDINNTTTTNNNNNDRNMRNMIIKQRIALRRTLSHGPVSIAEVIQPDTDFQVDIAPLYLHFWNVSFCQAPSSDYDGPFLEPAEPVTLALVAQLRDWFTDHDKIPIQLLYTILIQVPFKFYLHLQRKCSWPAAEKLPIYQIDILCINLNWKLF